MLGPGSHPFTYVALGDSAGVGFGAPRGEGYVDRIFARLGQRGEARLVNLCESGATSRGVLERQASRVGPAEPDLVTCFVGINDLWRGVPLELFARTMESIAGRLAPVRGKVVTSTLPDMTRAPIARVAEPLVGLSLGAIERRVLGLNEIVRGVAGRHGFRLVELFTSTRESLAEHPEFFSGDGFHPSSSGYQALADAFWPAVLGLLPARG